MGLGQSELGRVLAQHVRLHGLLAAGRAAEGLEFYLSGYDQAISKATVEWRLFSLFTDPATSPRWPDRWPNGFLRRSSGACLGFLAAQHRKAPAPLPEGLVSLPHIPPRCKRSLAEAWAAWPQCPALHNDFLRRRFARWLARYRPAVGPCMLALARLNDGESALEIGRRWSLTLDGNREAVTTLSEAARFGCLRPIVDRAIYRLLPAVRRNSEKVSRLLEAAAAIDDPASVVRLANVAERCELAAAAQARMRFLRIAALAELDRDQEVLAAYREHWLGRDPDFPEPERLLYVFLRRGERDLENHLLAATDVESSPSWVKRIREFRALPRPTVEHLEAWETLYREQPGDERVLVGLSTVVAACHQPLQGEWVNRLGLLERWRGLAEHERYRHLAGAYCVLLQPSEAEGIEAFESLLADARFDDEQLRRAARAYIAALRRLKDWPRLQALDRSGHPALAACTFQERELVRTLAQVGSTTPRDDEIDTWYRAWERLLSLRLETSEVIEVLDLFCSLSSQARQRDEIAFESEYADDVTLQVLRRAKAEAESLLLRVGEKTDRARRWRTRLREGGPGAVLQLLKELDGALPQWEEELHD